MMIHHQDRLEDPRTHGLWRAGGEQAEVETEGTARQVGRAGRQGTPPYTPEGAVPAKTHVAY